MFKIQNRSLFEILLFDCWSLFVIWCLLFVICGITRSVMPAPTPCRHMVSGLFHSPHRGSFHLSLTVLVHYRSVKVFSLTS